MGLFLFPLWPYVYHQSAATCAYLSRCYVSHTPAHSVSPVASVENAARPRRSKRTTPLALYFVLKCLQSGHHLGGLLHDSDTDARVRTKILAQDTPFLETYRPFPIWTLAARKGTLSLRAGIISSSSNESGQDDWLASCLQSVTSTWHGHSRCRPKSTEAS